MTTQNPPDETPQVSEPTTPVSETAAPEAVLIPKRGERRIRLVTKDGTQVECSIMPTVMWIKERFKAIVRRQQIVASKLSGLEDRRKALHEELTNAVRERAENADATEKTLTELYDEVAKLEADHRSMNYDLAGICLHFPMLKDKLLTKEDIAWEHCEESEVLQAQTFFLLA